LNQFGRFLGWFFITSNHIEKFQKTKLVKACKKKFNILKDVNQLIAQDSKTVATFLSPKQFVLTHQTLFLQ